MAKISQYCTEVYVYGKGLVFPPEQIAQYEDNMQMERLAARSDGMNRAL
jgi:hypothetical protein